MATSLLFYIKKGTTKRWLCLLMEKLWNFSLTDRYLLVAVARNKRLINVKCYHNGRTYIYI